jgi:hypothetical protein
MIVDAIPLEILPEKLIRDLLSAAAIRSITLTGKHGPLWRVALPAEGETPPADSVNLNHESEVRMIGEALSDLAWRADGDIRMTDAGGFNNETFDLVISKAALRSVLFIHSFYFFVSVLTTIAVVAMLAKKSAKLT